MKDVIALTRFRALALSLALLAGIAHAGPDPEKGSPDDRQLNTLYWQAQEELKNSDWNAALTHFGQLEKDMRAKDPKNADTALYWQAYTLSKARRGGEARAAVERLHREFPKSRWGKEADALLRTGERPEKPEAEGAAADEELAAMAVEGLMNAPAERALPLLKKVLAGAHTSKVKKRALFVLSQIQSPEALDVVVAVAKNGNPPELRHEAIQMLGVSGNERAVERLREIYQNSQDVDDKRRVLQAYLVADRKDLVLAAARGEPEPKLRRVAVETLGAMGATPELRQLFEASKDEETRVKVIEALGVAGDVHTLEALALSGDSEKVQTRAMHALGVAGGREALVRLYPKATTPALRDAVIQGLLISGDSKSLVELYKKAKTADEKRALLRTITAIGGDEAIEIIESELK